MKKRTVSLVFAMFLAAFTLTILHATGGGICTWCKVSSNPSENTGHCRAAATGDICYNDGSGPACSENGSKLGPCDS